MRKVVPRERVDERRVDSFGLKHVQQLTHVGRLFVLVAHELAVRSHRATVVAPHDIRAVAASHVRGTTMRAATELSDRDGLSLRPSLLDERTDALAEAVSGRGCAV